MIKFFKPIAIFSLIFALTYCGKSEQKEVTTKQVKANDKNIYNLVVADLIENEETIKFGQNLTEMLLPYDIPYNKIITLADKINKIYSITKLNAGKDYLIYAKNDSAKTAKYFIYEIDNKNFLVADLDEPIKVWLDKKEVKVIEHTVAGVIDYSLFSTINNLNLSDALAFKLSEIFGWQIDFYGLQKGDFFKVVFEEEYIDGKSVHTGKILAACFHHNNKEYFGFAFEKEGTIEYYDLAGNSLRRAFLKAPLKFSRISSKFTHSRLHPVLKIYRAHTGIDYAAPTGTPVQSIGDGVVLSAVRSGGAGNYVKIKHNATYSSGYMHLSKYGKGIRTGTRVKQGDVIGYVGSTGISTGPHLDFRFWKNNTPINYLTMEFPSSNPIDKKYKKEFDKIMKTQEVKLRLLDKPVTYKAIL